MTSILDYIYLLEVNRIVQGLAKKTNKPADHIADVWKNTEKEVISKHKYGVTDKYKEIGSIVRSKLGLKSDDEIEAAQKKAKEADMSEKDKKKAEERKDQKEFKKEERTD